MVVTFLNFIFIYSRLIFLKNASNWKSPVNCPVEVPNWGLSVCSSWYYLTCRTCFFNSYTVGRLSSRCCSGSCKKQISFIKSLWEIPKKIKFVSQCFSFGFLYSFLNISLVFPRGMDHHLTLFSAILCFVYRFFLLQKCFSEHLCKYNTFLSSP